MELRAYLESQIKERREQIADLERKRDLIKAQLTVLEDIAAHGGESGKTLVAETGHFQVQGLPVGFSMSSGWGRILMHVHRLGRSFTAQDINAAGDAVGHKTEMRNTRSQMAYYAKRKIIRRTGHGTYVLTDTGRAMAERSENAEGSGDKPEPSPRSVGASAPTRSSPNGSHPLGDV